MEWVASREDVPESIFRDLQRPTPAHHISNFSPLVNGMLANSTVAPLAPECAAPHVSRPARNDFDYQFSLGPNPEFDTDSVDVHRNNDPANEDDTSTHLRGNATSEDTSVGDPVVANDSRTIASSLPGNPSASGDSTIGGPRAAGQKKEDLLDEDADLKDANDKSRFPVKLAKTIDKKKASSKKLSSAANASVSLSAGTSTITGAPSHTKMCRDRLNNQFEKLRNTLPVAPAGVEVKHKAQLLDYAISVLKGMVDTTGRLEIELAVSSNKATMDWISKLVNKVESFPEAACEVMRLFSRRRGWKHAELWLAGKRICGRDATPEQAVLLTFCQYVTNDKIGAHQGNLEQFSKESESYAFKAREGVPGRVWSSMRPEWVTGLTDLKNFQRANLARKYGIKVCLALPVTITGKIEAVMCFYDTKHRPYDTQCLELGMRLAWALGNAIGGKRANVNVLSTSGTSST